MSPGAEDGQSCAVTYRDPDCADAFLQKITVIKVLLQSPGTCAQCSVAAGWEGVWRRVEACVCAAGSPCCPPETIIALFIGCTPIPDKIFKKIYFMTALVER